MSKASKNTTECVLPLIYLNVVVSGVCGVCVCVCRSRSMRLNEDDITYEYYI